MKYIDFSSNSFNWKLYLSEVFLKNVDIYGLIMCYIPYLLNKNTSTSIKEKISIFL